MIGLRAPDMRYYSANESIRANTLSSEYNFCPASSPTQPTTLLSRHNNSDRSSRFSSRPLPRIPSSKPDWLRMQANTPSPDVLYQRSMTHVKTSNARKVAGGSRRGFQVCTDSSRLSRVIPLFCRSSFWPFIVNPPLLTAGNPDMSHWRLREA